MIKIQAIKKHISGKFNGFTEKETKYFNNIEDALEWAKYINTNNGEFMITNIKWLKEGLKAINIKLKTEEKNDIKAN